MPTRATFSPSSLISGSACTVLLLNLSHGTRPASVSKAHTRALTAGGSPAAWAGSPRIGSICYLDRASVPHWKQVQETSSSGLRGWPRQAKGTRPVPVQQLSVQAVWHCRPHTSKPCRRGF